MRVFIAYKFEGEDKHEVRTILEKISNTIETHGHQTFGFYRDVQNWGNSTEILSNKEIIERALREVSKCDGLIAIVNAKGKSGGMLIEVGCAKTLGKQIFLAVNESVRTNVDRFLLAVADKIIYFKDLENLS